MTPAILLNNLDTAVLCVDISGKIVYSNPAATKMTGQSTKAIASLSLPDFLDSYSTGQQYKKLISSFNQMLKDEKISEVPAIALCWNSKYITVSLKRLNVTDNNKNSVKLILVTMVDVDSNQQELERLITQNSALLQRNKALTSTDIAVRRMILSSLFLSVIICLAISVTLEIRRDAPPQTLNNVLTTLLASLTVAIGFYFRSEDKSKPYDTLDSAKTKQKSLR